MKKLLLLALLVPLTGCPPVALMGAIPVVIEGYGALKTQYCEGASEGVRKKIQKETDTEGWKYCPED